MDLLSRQHTALPAIQTLHTVGFHQAVTILNVFTLHMLCWWGGRLEAHGDAGNDTSEETLCRLFGD